MKHATNHIQQRCINFCFHCNKALNNANIIVKKSINVSGGTQIVNSIIGFEFRDKQYSAIRRNGQFSLSRLAIKTSDSILDALDNNRFNRYINGKQIFLTHAATLNHSALVNSVHYFSVLPYGLNDKAVNKTFLGESIIKGKDYYKIKIIFNENGGGEVFYDVFIYWINKKTFTVDYLAYSYSESSVMGLRFREAYNERFINGVRFVDYNNYKPKDNAIALEDLEAHFERSKLVLLSKIELKKVWVKK